MFNLMQTNFPFFAFLSILIIFLFILLLPKNVFSFDALIKWDKNEEENIAGYKVFCREEYQNYNYGIPVCTGTGTTCNIYNLDDTKVYYFVARAFNTSGIESEDSEELKAEFTDGEIEVSITTDGYSFVGSGCFIGTGDSGL